MTAAAVIVHRVWAPSQAGTLGHRTFKVREEASLERPELTHWNSRVVHVQLPSSRQPGESFWI